MDVLRYKLVRDEVVAGCDRMEINTKGDWVKYVDITRQLSEAREEIARLRKDYMELIMAVRQKYPFETRHETALRYIEERETNIGRDLI